MGKWMISGFADEIHPDLEIQIEVLRECEMNYIELRSAYGKNISEYSLEEAEKLYQKLTEHKIKVSSIGSPIGKIDITRDDFNKHFDVFRHVIDLAHLFHTSYIRIFSFYIPKDSRHEEFTEEVIRRLKLMIEYASKENIILLLENEKGVYGDNAHYSKVILQELYGEHFKAVFDPANYVQCSQSVMEAYKELAPYIEYIHIKDAKTDGTVVLPGDGDGEVGELLKLLIKNGYRGFYSLEPHLVEFGSLKQLEREGEETKNEGEYNSGAEAFIAANSRLRLLLAEE